MEAKRLFKSHIDDINLKNEPFDIFGRITPIYDGNRWSFKLEQYENISKMCYKDSYYDYDELKGKYVFVGVYEEHKCIGVAILRHSKNKYMCIHDIKVLADYRRKGAGKELLSLAKEIAKDNNYLGLYTITQDSNLIACRFCLKNGFKIGGIDTKTNDQTDITFYLDI